MTLPHLRRKAQVSRPDVLEWRSLNPEGLAHARAATTRDGRDTRCERCRRDIIVETDGNGRLVEYEYVRGATPKWVVHRCAGRAA